MKIAASHAHRFVATLGWHRRLVAAGLAAGAVAFAVEAASPAEPRAADVTVAARDLAAGSTLGPDDLTTARLPPDALPDGVVDAAEARGGVLAGPVRAGEPITDRRLLGPALLDGWGDGLVMAPVRVADAGAAAYLRAGDRVNLLASAIDGTAGTSVVAGDVPVLAVTAADDALAEGALLMVAATPAQAADLAGAAITSRLSFTVGHI